MDFINLTPNNRQSSYTDRGGATASQKKPKTLQKQLLQNKRKKDLGQFYTDPLLAQKIIQRLPIHSGVTLLDPCCGSGSFLLAASRLGFTKLFGADIDENAVCEARQSVPGATVVGRDTIFSPARDVLVNLGLKEAVDVVVGNPPYRIVLDKDHRCSGASPIAWGRRNNLFVLALEKSFELCRDGGVISYIVPKNFLHVSGYSNLRKQILSTKTLLFIADLGAFFPDVRGEQVLISMLNSPPVASHEVEFLRWTGGDFEERFRMPQSFFKDEILLFECDEDVKIYSFLSGRFRLLGDFETVKIHRGKAGLKDSIQGKHLRKFGYKNTCRGVGPRIYLQNIYSAEAGVIGARGCESPAGETVTVVELPDEMSERCLLGILHSHICNFFLLKYVYNNSHLTVHLDASYLRKVPLACGDPVLCKEITRIVAKLEQADYLSEQWFYLYALLNKRVFDLYQLPAPHRQHILATLKKVQSARWHLALGADDSYVSDEEMVVNRTGNE